MARDKWEPRAYPIRDARSTKQVVGRIVNPSRGAKLGGKGEAKLLPYAKGGTGIGPVSDRGRGGK